MFVRLKDTEGHDIAVGVDNISGITEYADDPENVYCLIEVALPSDVLEWHVDHTLDDVLARIQKVYSSEPYTVNEGQGGAGIIPFGPLETPPKI